MSNQDRIRIVVADDHTIFRESLCRMLAMEDDFEIVGQAATGKQVVEGLLREHPDILLLDLRMPDADGFETLKQLRAKRLETKIIILTAAEEEEQYVRAVRNGARGVVVKQTAKAAPVEQPRARGRRFGCAGILEQGNCREALHQRADRKEPPP